MSVPIHDIIWHPCFRIIPSRFPPVDLFDRIAEPEDFSALAELEGLTNTRLRHENGEAIILPKDECVSGSGASFIMASFTHINRQGNRFGDGRFGVFYAAYDLNTAIAETRYHREKFMSATRQQAMELDMRVLLVDLQGKLHDIRNLQQTLPAVYAKEDYSASQIFARKLKEQGASGIVYDSVRLASGQCLAAFKPKILSNARQGKHLCYVWDGDAIHIVYEKKLHQIHSAEKEESNIKISGSH